MSHATSSHDENCHCVRCRPLERPCDCEWCRGYLSGERDNAHPPTRGCECPTCTAAFADPLPRFYDPGQTIEFAIELGNGDKTDSVRALFESMRREGVRGPTGRRAGCPRCGRVTTHGHRLDGTVLELDTGAVEMGEVFLDEPVSPLLSLASGIHREFERSLGSLLRGMGLVISDEPNLLSDRWPFADILYRDHDSVILCEHKTATRRSWEETEFHNSRPAAVEGERRADSAKAKARKRKARQDAKAAKKARARKGKH